MTQTRRTDLSCCCCGAQKPLSQVRPLDFQSPPIHARILRDHPQAGPGEHVCLDCISAYRLALVREALEAEKGELAQVEQDVLASLAEEEMVARNADAEFDEKLSVGQRLSDRMAGFGGSWAFIGAFGAVLALWILYNSLASASFDPFPFILLNLVLSCLAAIQAPVIMMSQNRQEARDRARSVNDYRINLKAEIEIRSLHAKLDSLISHQWQRLLEIQELQMEMLADREKQ
jgi:uncharacterized membrane protein